MKVKEIMRKATAFLLLTSMNLGSIGANTIYAADMTGDGTNVATQVVPEPLKQGTLWVEITDGHRIPDPIIHHLFRMQCIEM